MNEVEKMYENAGVAKPVIKKWHYDGYYEDFSWESLEEDCTKLLKYFDNSIDKLNDRIQQMKKEENTNYDRYTDSVDTEFGRVEKAYIDYPPFTAEKQLELIKFLCTKRYIDITFTPEKEYYIFAYFVGCGFDKNFDEALAMFVNQYWNELSEEERKQIKNILESEVRE
jgi:succinate dehydrogenase flavin-adding protein (antitoxin of CptAB toxin-antitoxin module)